MPARYDIDTCSKIVFSTYEGNTTSAEIIETFQDFIADPDYDPAYRHLCDLRQMGTAELGFAEIFAVFSRFARTYDSHGVRVRVALVVPRDAAFGIARIFENLSETSDTVIARMFDDLETARLWLSATA